MTWQYSALLALMIDDGSGRITALGTSLSAIRLIATLLWLTWSAELQVSVCGSESYKIVHVYRVLLMWCQCVLLLMH